MKLYDVVYQRQNAQNQVIAAVTFPVNGPMDVAGEIADGIGQALKLKPNGTNHSWLTIMPTDNDEYVFLVEVDDVN